MRILLTNNTLSGRAGSELYVRDLALALMRRGHDPVVFSTLLGEVAEELRAASIPVIDDLESLTVPPDVIHGQHHLDTVCALLQFPTTPAVFACHGWLPWEESAPVFPNILRYVAVDDLCRERLVTTKGIDPGRIQVQYNFVDLNRFQPRPDLPGKPRSALIFSNYAGAPDFQVDAIVAGCRQAGIDQVDVVGLGAGSSVPAPETLLGNYDVVFGKARCALEAMATGCAVIVADRAGLGGMVTSDNVQALRPLNFGLRTLQQAPIDADRIVGELDRYDADDAAKVSRWVRANAAMDPAIDQWIRTYEEVRSAWAVGVGPTHEMQVATARYLRTLAPELKQRHEGFVAAQETHVGAEHLQRERDQLAQERDRLAEELRESRSALQAVRRRLRQVKAAQERVQSTRGWRALNTYWRAINRIRGRAGRRT